MDDILNENAVANQAITKLTLALEELDLNQSLIQRLRRKVQDVSNGSSKFWIDGKIDLVALIEELWDLCLFERKIMVRSVGDDEQLGASALLKDARYLHLMDEKINERAADEYAKSGGDSINPLMLTISFPGKTRGTLFKILNKMELRLGVDGDVHAMNDNSKNAGNEPKLFPKAWTKELCQYPPWRELKSHLHNVINIDPLSKHQEIKDDDLVAPTWFVDHWGRAAWNTAQRSRENGAAIVILKGWFGYDKSPWCQLEYKFCQCLTKRFPGSVYVWEDSDNHYYLE